MGMMVIRIGFAKEQCFQFGVKALRRDGMGRGLSELMGWVRYLSQCWREFVPERRDSYGHRRRPGAEFGGTGKNFADQDFLINWEHKVSRFVVSVLPLGRFLASTFFTLSCFPPFTSVPHMTILSETRSAYPIVSFPLVFFLSSETLSPPSEGFRL